MAVNRERPHLIILPEDDANRQLAIGFALEVGKRQLQVEPIAGGWGNALDDFQRDLQSSMDQYPGRHVAILIDFDERGADRLRAVTDIIPEHLRDRVFVIGARKDPEQLKRATKLGSLEKIGQKLAEDCRNGTQNVWGHAELAHNDAELNRLCAAIKFILFQQ